MCLEGSINELGYDMMQFLIDLGVTWKWVIEVEEGKSPMRRHSRN